MNMPVADFWPIDFSNPTAAAFAAPAPVRQLAKIPGKLSNSFALFNSNEEYHSDKHILSSSMLKPLLRSGAHFQSFLRMVRKETEAMKIGTALHCAVLEPDRFATDYVVYTGEGDKSSKEFKEFAKANPDVIILKAAEYEKVIGMRDSILGYNYGGINIRDFFQNADKEMSVYWTDEETGIPLRIRLDAGWQNIIVDLKKTIDCQPHKFMWSCDDYRYDMQAYMYSEGMRLYTGERQSFYFLAVDQDDPYSVWLHEANEEFLAQGEARFRAALRLYKKCMDEKNWGGYDAPYSAALLPARGRLVIPAKPEPEGTF